MKSLQEGLLDALKARKQITQVQGLVADEYEKLIDENPKKYRSGKQVLDMVWDFAKKTYDEVVDAEGAITFNQWWPEFSKAHANMLDRTVFRN
jgi:hypothetical protein